MPKAPLSNASLPSFGKDYGAAYELVSLFLSPILTFSLLAWWVDSQWLHSGGWVLLAGFLFGSATGIYVLLKRVFLAAKTPPAPIPPLAEVDDDDDD